MKTRNIILYFIGLLAFCSCDDMFEPADENNRQLEDLALESSYAHGILIYGYDRLPYITNVANQYNWTDVATDDAVTNLKTSNFLNMATGTWASDNNPMSRWDNCKDGIQYVNLFFQIVDKYLVIQDLRHISGESLLSSDGCTFCISLPVFRFRLSCPR